MKGEKLIKVLTLKMKMIQGSELMKVACVGVLLIISVGAVEYSEQNEGHALGLLPLCPGSDKPAAIKPEHLSMLKIAVLGSGHVLTAKWTSYNYYNVEQLAKDPDFDLHRRTMIYAPGYLESAAIPVGRYLGSIYKRWGYNVLLLEYVQWSSNVFPVVVRMMRPIGKHVAEMLAKLVKLGLDPKKLELYGLSLGGVSMGFIAKSFREITGRNISAITALDPTGPCMRHRSPEHRLDRTDADFVLHVVSNSAGYGIAIPVGHITVYVNGGEYQTGFFANFGCDDICSHMVAYYVWISALYNPGKFIAMKCDSVQQAKDHNCYDRKPMETITVDLFTDRSKQGIYYLAATNRDPYYLGKKGLKRSGDPVSQIGTLNAVAVLRVK